MSTSKMSRRKLLATTVLAAAAAATAATAVTYAAPADAAKGRYVAIAMSSTTLGQYGYAHRDNLDQAIWAAQSNCGAVAPNCVVQAWSDGGCVAIAQRGVNPNGGALGEGGASGSNRRQAEERAIRAAGGGKVVYSYCL
jgi:Domain of unknown function (DUF4189)